MSRNSDFWNIEMKATELQTLKNTKMKTENMILENFSTSNCEILDNDQLISLVGGDGSNDGTLAPDPKIWIRD